MPAPNRAVYPVFGFAFNLVLGLLYAWSIFILPLESHFGWSRAETSLTASLIFAFFSAGTLAGGMLLPRIKSGPNALLGGLIAGGGFFLSSFTTSLTMFYICYGIMGGLGIGIAYQVPISAVRWFPDKKGLVSGILTMGMALGTFLLGSLGARALLPIVGWQATFQIMGLTVIGMSLVCGFILKAPPADYQPAGYTPPPGHTGLWGFTLPQVFTLKAYWMFLLWAFLLQNGGLVILTHIVPLVQEKGLSAAEGALALGIIALANAGGRFLFGYLFDRLGYNRSMALDGLVMTAGLLVLTHLPASFIYPALLLGAILVGMSYGGGIAQLVAGCMSFFGPRYFPVIFGSSTLATMLASFSGPFLGGYLKDSFHDYSAVLYITATLGLLAALAAWLLKKPEPPR
ncbi:MAG: MFS transporter [Desulfarculales bacterium]|jgi:OFA family oxalate/formate antiporter-like MFS transporter|nr:MFS transporter [Desulfarculales bacterium]